MATGCSPAASSPRASSHAQETAKIEQANDIFAYIAGLLNGLADYDAVESETRDIFDLNEAARRALETGVPPALVSQLNQWIVLQAPLADWRREPLLETLPARLRKTPQLDDLDDMGFSAPDGIELRQAIWLRDASNAAAGATQDDLERARRLFDWVVRNIQLDPPDGGDSPPRLAWQTLLLGRGQAIDRAWLFALLARQQGLDVVMLARPASDEGGKSDAADEADESSETPPRPWIPALLLEKELYLFEPSLGLPLPGPGGESIATLSQAAADDALLRRLDLDAEHPYQMKAADLHNVTALIEASPMYLAQRMALLESQLAGLQRVVISLDASALAERLRECQHVGDVSLWAMPYERLVEQARQGKKGRQRLAADFEPFMVPFQRQVKKKVEMTPALWKGRVLHLMGKFSGERGAMRFYQLARPSDAEIARGIGLPTDQLDELRNKVSPDDWRIAGERYSKLAPVAKHDASYWLGLIAYERESYKTAADYFTVRTIDVAADSPWRSGALYNLGRVQESLGLIEGAVSVYRDYDSPQRHGNLLRARWLEEKPPASAKTE